MVLQVLEMVILTRSAVAEALAELREKMAMALVHYPEPQGAHTVEELVVHSTGPQMVQGPMELYVLFGGKVEASHQQLQTYRRLA
jgi:hypothetical protein